MSSIGSIKVGSLLRIMRLCAGLDQTLIGQGLGVSQPTVSRWESGNWLPDATQVEGWLAACQERLTDGRAAGAAQVVRRWYAAGDQPARERLLPLLDQAMLALVSGAAVAGGAVVPYFADVAAGVGEAQEQRQVPRDSWEVPQRLVALDPGCYALRVTGDSMAPQLLDGDMVVVSPAALLIDGCIVAAFVEPDGDIVKVYRRRPDRVVALEPCNPAYPTVLLAPDGGREARIWGRVVLVQRDL